MKSKGQNNHYSVRMTASRVLEVNKNTAVCWQARLAHIISGGVADRLQSKRGKMTALITPVGDQWLGLQPWLQSKHDVEDVCYRVDSLIFRVLVNRPPSQLVPDQLLSPKTYCLLLLAEILNLKINLTPNLLNK